MSKRAFRPEALGPLEGRRLLSAGVAHVHRGPVGLSGVGFNTANLRLRGAFEQYALGGNFALLRTQIASISSGIPYHRVDGLGPRTNQILDQMRMDQADGVSGAIKTAYQRVSAETKADVGARIANGDVFIFDKNG